MAKGSMVYLAVGEIDHLAQAVEWDIVRCTEQIGDMREDLRRAVYRRRTLGKKPERSDFSTLLPEPEVDYQFALKHWQLAYDAPLVLLREIRKVQAKRQRLRLLLKKLWYYGWYHD